MAGLPALDPVGCGVLAVLQRVGCVVHHRRADAARGAARSALRARARRRRRRDRRRQLPEGFQLRDAVGSRRPRAGAAARKHSRVALVGHERRILAPRHGAAANLRDAAQPRRRAAALDRARLDAAHRRAQELRDDEPLALPVPRRLEPGDPQPRGRRDGARAPALSPSGGLTGRPRRVARLERPPPSRRSAPPPRLVRVRLPATRLIARGVASNSTQIRNQEIVILNDTRRFTAYRTDGPHEDPQQQLG